MRACLCITWLLLIHEHLVKSIRGVWPMRVSQVCLLPPPGNRSAITCFALLSLVLYLLILLFICLQASRWGECEDGRRASNFPVAKLCPAPAYCCSFRVGMLMLACGRPFTLFCRGAVRQDCAVRQDWHATCEHLPSTLYCNDPACRRSGRQGRRGSAATPHVERAILLTSV